MKRAEAVCFDECGWLTEEVFQVIEPYTAQDKNFKMGGGIDVTTLPKELPNQLLYTSSASSVDSYFYTKYKQYSKAMILGSRDHFVADINCDVMISATQRGKIYPASLLSQKKVDNAMTENKEKALREYYNIFTTDAGANSIVRRAVIVKNSKVRSPILYNDDGSIYGLFYDPARSLDNSIVLVGKFYDDEIVGWKMDIVNCVNFMDVNKKKKTPMRTPDQIRHLKRLLLDYNGKDTEDYKNIISLGVDAGSGGGGKNIADFFMEEWYEEGHEGDNNYKHHGLIDKEFSAEYVKNFPEAIDTIKLFEPSAYKSVMYESLIEMLNSDLIGFTADYDNKGYLTLLDIDEKIIEKAKKEIQNELKDEILSAEKYQELLEEKLSDVNSAKTRVYKLSPEEEIALTQIDALKEEVVNMVRRKRESGKDAFELTSEKQNKMHDDRSYCLAMAGYCLSELRRKNITQRKKPQQDFSTMIAVSKKPKAWGKH